VNYFISLANEAAVFGALAAVQALLLNRLGLAFAAVPAFAGLAAYAAAAGPAGDGAAVLAAAAGLAVGMILLANRLLRDHYLLATLAALECLGVWVGTSRALGEREGLAAPAGWDVGGPGFEARMLPLTFGGLAVVLLAVRGVLGSAAGAAVDRLREHPEAADRWCPAGRVRGFVVGLAVVLAAGTGVVYLRYHGRVSPGIFSLESALLVLAFTVMAGRRPELAAAAALLYGVLPFLLTKAAPVSHRGAADLIRICWGVLLVAAVVVPHRLRTRRPPPGAEP
jgi:hypothetical protein